MESWGRGISLIMQSCREQGLPEPKIEIVPNFVNLTIWFKDLLSALGSPQDTPRHPKSHPKTAYLINSRRCRLYKIKLSSSVRHLAQLQKLQKCLELRIRNG